VSAVVTYRYKPTYKLQAAIILDVLDDIWVSLYIIGSDGTPRYASHVEYNVGWFWPAVPSDTGDTYGGYSSL